MIWTQWLLMDRVLYIWYSKPTQSPFRCTGRNKLPIKSQMRGLKYDGVVLLFLSVRLFCCSFVYSSVAYAYLSAIG